jgi:hypothetical protein
MEPHVEILRAFKDRYLLTNAPGRAFVNFYYRYSPPLARLIESNSILRFITRVLLLPVVAAGWVTLYLGMVMTVMILLLILTVMVLKHYRKEKTL